MSRRAPFALLALLLFACVWQCASLIFGESSVPGMRALASEAFGTLSHNALLASHPELRNSGLGVHIEATLGRTAIAVFGGCAIGVGLTILARAAGLVGQALVGILDLQRVLPPLMFVPLTLFWIAPGEGSILFAATIYSASTFALFALEAFKQADAHYAALMTVLNERSYRRYRHVLLPSALPALQGGFRLSSAITIGIVLVIEYFVGQTGLGKVLQIALNGADVSLMVAVVIWAVGIVLVFDGVALGIVWLFRPDARVSYG